MKRPDGFLIGLGLAIGLALLFPGPGARGGFLHPELLTKAGVALIFLLHGAALPFEALKAGTLRWPLHLVAQSATFLLFPLMGLLFIHTAGPRLPADLQLGFFFLCALPSTVSSSVAMTATAHGNVSAAIFNATLSSLLGVFITPLWIAALLRTEGASLPLGSVIGDLLLWIILPLAVGQLSRPLSAAWAARNKPLINRVDRGIILLLVYTSFCESQRQGVWSQHGLAILFATLGGAALLLFAALQATLFLCRRFGFPPGDRAAVVFCGSKKTLASGVPMASLIFGTHPGIGLILLPLIIYHTLQLAVGGWLAARWGRQSEERAAYK